MQISSISLLITAFVNALLGITLVSHARTKKEHFYLLMIIVAVLVWALSLFGYSVITDLSLATFLSRTSYIGAGASALLLVNFTVYFSNSQTTRIIKGLHILNAVALTLLGIGVYFGSVLKSIYIGNGERVLMFGNGYLPYMAFVSACFLVSFIILYKKYREEGKVQRKKQFEFVFVGILLAVLGGIITNMVLPTAGYFNLYWLGPIFTLLMVLFIFVAISRYHLFQIKLIVAEFLTFTILTGILTQIFLAATFEEKLYKAALLLTVGIFGGMVIKSTVAEVEAKERLQVVAEQIDTTNKRLEQIEQQKADFISIASHQLRTPLTAIKGYTSMLLEGSFGAVAKPISETLQKMFISSQKLVSLVEDLLTVSRIERGKIVYNFASIDVADVVRTATKEKMPEIEDRKLGLVVQTEHNDDKYLVNGDAEKMKQIFVNIIDNSIKYTSKGLIRIYISRDELKDRIRVSISDTGVGMERKVLDTLFLDPEQRIRQAGDKETLVSGIGMYVANQMVKAHQGSIWADSDGVGRGSTFFVEFPAVG